MGDRETAFLWSAYASEAEGIAIQSTIGPATALAHSNHNGSDVVVNPFKYVDYEEYKVPSGIQANLFHIAYLKRLEFEPERT